MLKPLFDFVLFVLLSRTFLHPPRKHTANGHLVQSLANPNSFASLPVNKDAFPLGGTRLTGGRFSLRVARMISLLAAQFHFNIIEALKLICARELCLNSE
jgi:hypothetical protein